MRQNFRQLLEPACSTGPEVPDAAEYAYFLMLECPTMAARIPVPESLRALDDDIERACQAVKGLSHPIRLKALCVLGDQEMSVNDLAVACETSQSNISQHLSILRQCGILATRKESTFVHYRINDPRMIQLINLMRDMFCSQAH